MSQHKNSALLLLFLFLMVPFLGCLFALPNITNLSDISDNSMSAQTWDSDFSDISVVSDYPPGYPNVDWSWMARIAIDSHDNLHVVWSDDTDGIWGADSEILYSKYDGTSWSTPIAISHSASWTGTSDQPSIAIDSYDNIHVVWRDESNHLWQLPAPETDILYSMYNATLTTWSTPIGISDDMSQWNDGDSKIPFIAIDSNDDLHVVWHDSTLSQPWNVLNNDVEILYVNQTSGTWGQIIPISDDSTDFNDDFSGFPSIAIDGGDNIHIVWHDDQDNLSSWGIDREILYRNFTVGLGWQDIIGLSGVGVNIWNNDTSEYPIIAIDPNPISMDPPTYALHVVWVDDTNGTWGTDEEIFYSNSTNGAIWSNATALSGVGVNSWNNGGSYGPWIIVDNSSLIHVVWHDDTNSTSEWGTDREIFYSNSTNGAIWLNATCLSDQPDHTYNNNDFSQEPCIAYDSYNFVHVVWWDVSPTYPWYFSPSDYDIIYTTNYVTPSSNGGGTPPFPWWIIVIILLLLLLILLLYLYNRRRKNKKSHA